MFIYLFWEINDLLESYFEFLKLGDLKAPNKRVLLGVVSFISNS